MASIVERNGKYKVVYNYTDERGKKKQKWETCQSLAEAKRRKTEIEYKKLQGKLVIPHCTVLEDLLQEYVNLYGRDKWSLSTYEGNQSVINNYINPLIGKTKLSEINTHFLERYYQRLLTTPAVPNPMTGKQDREYVGPSTIRDAHKILRSCFSQAVKWELMDKNPAAQATVPRYKSARREIWTADMLAFAMEVCSDDILKLAINLSFSACLRIGEVLGLTWDCVDISEEAIREHRASITINKELQRVSKEAVEKLDEKDIILKFPEGKKKSRTIRILKTPKTETSIRKVYLPQSVAEMLIKHRKEQDELKEFYGTEYKDYNLVMCSSSGSPLSQNQVDKKMKKLIKENNLPPVVFHSLRHSSVTYKLKLSGGDIKSVQGDSGHAQVDMVTDVYSHIIDEDRRKNTELFEEAFYKKKNLNPDMNGQSNGGNSQEAPAHIVTVPETIDPVVLQKALLDPEMAALIKALAAGMEKAR